MTIAWTRPALDHIESLRDHIGVDSPDAARTAARRVLAAGAALARFPNRGRPGRVADTRELVVPGLPYVIAYRVTDGTVQILRVLHAARRWPKTL